MSHRFVFFGAAAAMAVVAGCGSSSGDDAPLGATTSALYGIPGDAAQIFLCTGRTHFVQGAGSAPRQIPASFQFEAVRYVRPTGAHDKVYGIGIGFLDPSAQSVFTQIGVEAWGLSLPPNFLEDYNPFTLLLPQKTTARVITLSETPHGVATLPDTDGHFDVSYEGNGYVFWDVPAAGQYTLVKEQATFRTTGGEVQFEGRFYANVITRDRVVIRPYGGIATFSGNCTPRS